MLGDNIVARRERRDQKCPGLDDMRLYHLLCYAGYTAEQADAVFGIERTPAAPSKDEALTWLRGWLLQGGYPGYRTAIAKIDEVLK